MLVTNMPLDESNSFRCEALDMFPSGKLHEVAFEICMTSSEPFGSGYHISTLTVSRSSRQATAAPRPDLVTDVGDRRKREALSTLTRRSMMRSGPGWNA